MATVSSCGIKLQYVLSGLERKAKTLEIHMHFCGFCCSSVPFPVPIHLSLSLLVCPRPCPCPFPCPSPSVPDLVPVPVLVSLSLSLCPKLYVWKLSNIGAKPATTLQAGVLQFLFLISFIMLFTHLGMHLHAFT